MQMKKLNIIVVVMLLIVVGAIVPARASQELAKHEEHKGKARQTTEQAETTETTTEAPKQSYNLYDYQLLAQIIAAEAGSDYVSHNTRLYVGSVVLNRVNSPLFPDSIEGVLWQHGQYYSCITDTFWSFEPSEDCKQVAEYLLTHGSVLPANVLYQANFRQGSGVFCESDTIYFCYQ